MIKLNLGCGDIRPDGWINTDSSLNANLQRIPFIGKLICRVIGLKEYDNNNLIFMNLNNKWNFNANSVDVVYSSHLLEHLSVFAVDLYLNEAYRVLKLGGVLRIVVPDLYQICKRYIEQYESADFDSNSTEYIMWAINMHREGQYGKVGFLKSVLLELQGYPHQHKYMYDEKSLKTLVSKYNFRDIKIHRYGFSELIDDITVLEGTAEKYLSVYLECKK